MNPQRRHFLGSALAGSAGLAAVSLAGCATTGSSAKLETGTFTFAADDGAKLFVRRWADVAGTPKGVVQIAHGATEHSGRYARFAAFLNANGYIAYADDHRGHGNTRVRSGALGDAGPDAWNRFLADQANLTDLIRRENPGRRVVLFGHSMGSMMAQDYAARYGKRVDGVVLCASNGVLKDGDAVVAYANQQVADGAAKPSQMLAQVFASFNTPFTGKPGFDWLSRDPVEVKKYMDDPLCGFLFNNELARDFMKGLRDMWLPVNEARIPKDLPLYVIAGDKDPVGGNTLGLVALLERYRGYGLSRVSHTFYPGARHELLNETNRDEVQRDILNWLDRLA